LRWAEIRRRAPPAPESRPDESSWPGSLPAGDHVLVLSGRDPDVEIDAVCARSPGDLPDERFPLKPERAVTRELADFGARGDGVSDDTLAVQAALDALAPGDALHLPAGRLRVTAPLTLAVGQVTLVGEGAAATVIS
jgi:hypothetical protein